MVFFFIIALPIRKFKAFRKKIKRFSLRKLLRPKLTLLRLLFENPGIHRTVTILLKETQKFLLIKLSVFYHNLLLHIGKLYEITGGKISILLVKPFAS